MVKKACANPVFGMANGVEVLNARGSEEENAFSSIVRDRVKLPATGASDAHNCLISGRLLRNLTILFQM